MAIIKPKANSIFIIVYKCKQQ